MEDFFDVRNTPFRDKTGAVLAGTGRSCSTSRFFQIQNPRMVEYAINLHDSWLLIDLDNDYHLASLATALTTTA